MGYQMQAEESHVSVEHCFECKETFVLTPEHHQNYIDSSLCQECYDKAMRKGSDVEFYAEKVSIQLDEIIKEIAEINKILQEIVGGK
jgi:superfamily II helicase